MGLPMATNLLKAGHQVIGYDIQENARIAFAELGGKTVTHLSDLTKDIDVLITMLQKGKQVEAICLGSKGLYLSVKSLKLHIDCSSIDVETTKHLSEEATQRQIKIVDAPVSGGVAGAKARTLTFMVGGEQDAFIKAQPILNAMGQNIYHTGDSGTGQAAKICNNMILGISMIAISEAFVLAEHLGLSRKSLFEVVTHSSGQCWAMSKYVPVPDVLPDVPANRDYQPGFTAAMMLKDLHLSQDAASKSKVKTVLAEKALQIYQQFYDAGYGELDFSAIIKEIE